MERPCGSEDYEVLEEDLESALKLATVWDFQAVRLVAIKRIENLSLEPARVIQLAQLYDVHHWITPEIERLSLRPESLTSNELKQVGFEIAAEICTFRDMKSHLALQMAKEYISSKDVDIVDSCISKHIRKQRGAGDQNSSIFDASAPTETPSRSETDSEETSTLRDEGSDKDRTDESGPTGSKPILLSRDKVQEALDCSQADRSALDDRIAGLKTRLEAIYGMEKQAQYQEKVKSVEDDLRDSKTALIDAQIALANIVIRAPRRGGSGPLQAWPMMDVYSPQVEAENVIRTCRARIQEAETRLNEAKAGLRGA